MTTLSAAEYIAYS